MNQQLSDHLVELRQQYRIQQLESEQRRHYLAQQLSHVDALLVDQLESPDLLESLVELRHQYQQQIAECDHTVAHCQEQLTHVNALLADQIVEQHEHLTLRATVEEQRSRTLAVQSQERSRTLSPAAVNEEMPEESELEKGLDEQAGSASDETVSRTANSFSQAATEELTTNLEQVEPESNDATSELLDKLEEQSSPEATENLPAETELLEESCPEELPREMPLLPQYQHLTKLEALSQLLWEKARSALHIDWLLRELFGELTEEQTIAEKAHLSKILKDGVEQGLWERVPGAPDCYTINHELVEPDAAKKTTQKQQEKTQSTSSRQPGLTVLPKYSGASLIDAVELILANQAEEELTIEQVTKAMYGELTGRKLSQAKEVVGGALWRGAAAGHFIRVAGQKGVYTLETGIIEPASGANDTASGARETGEAPLKFLPVYVGMSFIDAVGAVLREHVGKVMTPEQVTRALYGDELSGIRLSKARHKVNRVLWEGASRKKWRRLTGVIGRYTLD